MVHQQAGTGLAAVVVAVSAGSDDDPADCHGMAHLVEHLLFQRSESAGAGGHAADVARLGGTINAETHRDHTIFHGLCPTTRLLDMVELEVARFERLTGLMAQEGRALLLPLDAVVAENAVIADEIRAADTFASLWDRSRAVLHPGSRDGFGSPAHLAEATPATIARWFRAQYRPDRMAFVIVGDVTSRQVDEMEAILGRLSGGPAADADEHRLARPHPRATSACHETGPLVTGFPGLAVAHPMPDPMSERRSYIAHVLLTHLLGRTVLPTMVRQSAAWTAASVACGFYGEWLTSTSLDLVQATFVHASGTSSTESMSLWRQALAQSAEAARDPVVLTRTVNTLLLASLRGADSLVGQATTLARDVLLFGGTADPQARVSQLSGVSARDLGDAATRLLSSPVAITALHGDHVPAVSRR